MAEHRDRRNLRGVNVVFTASVKVGVEKPPSDSQGVKSRGNDQGGSGAAMSRSKTAEGPPLKPLELTASSWTKYNPGISGAL